MYFNVNNFVVRIELICLVLAVAQDINIVVCFAMISCNISVVMIHASWIE